MTETLVSPLRLLVVDDEPDLEVLIRQKFRKKIRAGEYDIAFARNGREALDTLSKAPDIDIILTDINMPVMDGLTLLARLAEREELFKAVVISAYGDMENIRTAMNRGAFDFITKPIDFSDLDITIAKTAAEILKLKQGALATQQMLAMDHELKVATRIQESILPKTFPPFPDRHELEIFAAMTPARQVGGDFYDFFFIDETHLAFVIGDVSGKGIPAALFMAVCRTLIKATAPHEHAPDACLNNVNRLLCADNAADLFVTVFYAVLDTTTGEVAYSNAGHNAPYWIHTDGTPPSSLENLGGLVLGVMKDTTYTQRTLTLKPGESLYLYTDGVTEAMDANNGLFDDLRLIECLEKAGSASLEELAQCVGDALQEFTKDHPQHDDITMLGVRYTGEGR